MSNCSLHPNFLCKLLKYRAIFFKNTTEISLNAKTSAAKLISLSDPRPTPGGVGGYAAAGQRGRGPVQLPRRDYPPQPGDVIHRRRHRRDTAAALVPWITTDTRHPLRRHRHPGDVIRTPPPKRGRRPHPEEDTTAAPWWWWGWWCCCSQEDTTTAAA